MNLVRLADHTVDLDLLPPVPTVLDVGCLGFNFSAAVRKVRPHARIVCIDPEPAVAGDQRQIGFEFIHAALVGHNGKTDVLMRWHDGQGHFLASAATSYLEQCHAAYHGNRIEVSVMRIWEVLPEITHWDLVKLDCEASEFLILENWPGPIATQISVEFHDYVNRTQYDEAYFQGLRAKLHWYNFLQHEDLMVGGGMGHWDSLLVLR